MISNAYYLVAITIREGWLPKDVFVMLTIDVPTPPVLFEGGEGLLAAKSLL